MTTKLEAIRAREQAATPGPWESRRYRSSDGSPAAHIDVVPIEKGDLRPTLPIAWNGSVTGDNDMVFIAHSRADIPLLLAVAEAAAPIVNDMTPIEHPTMPTDYAHGHVTNEQWRTLVAAMAPLMQGVTE